MDESKQISDQQQLLVPPPSSPSSSSSSQSTLEDVNGGDVVVNTPTDGGAFSTTTITTTTTIPSDCSPSTGDAAISTTQQEKETPDAIAPCSSSSTTAEEKKSLLPDPPCGRLLSEQELLPCSSLSSQATLGDVNGGDVVVNTPTDGGALSTTTTISSDGSPTDFSSNTNHIEHPEWSCLSVSTTGTPAVVGSPRGTLSKMSFPNELCKYKTVIRHSFITQGVPENTELLVNGYGTLVSSSALLPNWKNNKFMLNQFSVGLLLEIPKQQNPGQNSENSTINTIKFNK